MTLENKERLLRLLRQHEEVSISEQIDYEKFYLYSIITHSTAIEGSTVTEVEAQLLFDEGITSSKRTMMEQMMNLDLKVAYDYGREWIKEQTHHGGVAHHAGSESDGSYRQRVSLDRWGLLCRQRC